LCETEVDPIEESDFSEAAAHQPAAQTCAKAASNP
jgi:hypothetical protein